MLPSSPHDNIANSLTTYVEDMAQLRIGLAFFGVPSSDFDNVRLAENGTPVSVAACLALLVLHILEVVLNRAQEQMRWIHAKTIVASVANQHACRYWPMCQFVGNTMSAAYVLILVKSKEAVASTGVFYALPNPTTINAGFINLVPKAIMKFVTRGFWGMLGVHRNSSFLCQAWDGYRRCQALLLLPSIIPQEGTH